MDPDLRSTLEGPEPIRNQKGNQMAQSTFSRKPMLLGLSLLVVLAISAGAVALASSGAGGRASTEALEGGPSSEPAQALSPQAASAFPVLTKTRDTVESSQQALIEKAVELLERQALAGRPGANASLARAYYESGSNAGYLVPAGAGTLCMVQIYQSELLGMGCSQETALSQHGSISVRVVAGGYEISGLLPKGADMATITLAGHVTAVKPNEYGGFDQPTTAWPEKVSYRLPSGGESVQTMPEPPTPAQAG